MTAAKLLARTVAFDVALAAETTVAAVVPGVGDDDIGTRLPAVIAATVAEVMIFFSDMIFGSLPA